jgi:hemolysin activation/secretion protein
MIRFRAIFLVLIGIFLLDQAVFVACAQTRKDAPRVPETRRHAPEAPKRAPAITQPAAPDAAIKDGEQTFILAAVQVTGSDIYSPERLAEFYEPLLARSVTARDVEKVVAAITKMYRDDGYILSRAVAQPQGLAFGILNIDIIEGYVEKVTYKGDHRARQGLLDSYAAAIAAERPLTLDTLERYVLLASDLPGMAVRPSMRPLDDDRRAHELILEVSHDTYGADLSIDNRSTQSVGRRIAQASLYARSPFGLSESFRLSGFTVPEDYEELEFVDSALQIPVGGEGTVLSFEGWYSLSKPADGSEAFKQESVDERAALVVSHPFVRRRDLSVIASSIFEFHNTEETSFGARVYKDRLRVARVSVRTFAQDPWGGDNLVSVTGSAGFSILDASRNSSSLLSRLDGKSDFTKVVAEYRRFQSLPGNWSAMFGITGQRAGTRLLSAEEFRAGGSQYGRAYDPSEISGEDGAAGFAELRYDIPLDWQFVQGIRVFSFYDLAAAWEDSRGVGTTKQSIASAGIGTQVFTTKDVSLSFELAEPLTARVAADRTDGKDLRAFFSVSASF